MGIDDEATGGPDDRAPRVSEPSYVETGRARVDTTDDAWDGSMWSRKEGEEPPSIEEPSAGHGLPDLRASARARELLTEDLDEAEGAAAERKKMLAAAVGAGAGTMLIIGGLWALGWLPL